MAPADDPRLYAVDTTWLRHWVGQPESTEGVRLHRLADEIDELRAAAAWHVIRDWAQDDMPSLGVPVLVMTRVGRVIVAHLEAAGVWVTEPGDWRVYPTHWMPLPAPPVVTP